MKLGCPASVLEGGALDLVSFLFPLASTETVQPALIAVQPPILAFQSIVVDKLNKARYALVCLLKLIVVFQPLHPLNPYASIFLPTPTP